MVEQRTAIHCGGQPNEDWYKQLREYGAKSKEDL